MGLISGQVAGYFVTMVYNISFSKEPKNTSCSSNHPYELASAISKHIPEIERHLNTLYSGKGRKSCTLAMIYSYFAKGCRKIADKYRRQDRKVVSSEHLTQVHLKITSRT